MRSSESTLVEVPPSCSLVQELESRRSVPFDFSDPKASLQVVLAPFPNDGAGKVGTWEFKRMREVHRENQYFLPYHAPSNLTVWWGVELNVQPDSSPCLSGVANCAKFRIGMEAVFPVFIYERIGNVASLIAEMGGAISLVISVFGFAVFIYRFFDKRRKAKALAPLTNLDES